MLTSSEFNSNLDRFQRILETSLESPHSLRLLSCHIVEHHGQRALKFTLEWKVTLIIVISFDKFFQVPVLYFQVMELRIIDTFEQLVPVFDIKERDLIQNPQSLCLENHPFVPGTYFMVHPCESQQTVETFVNTSLTEDSDRIVNYLLSWNALYGTGVFSGLNLRYIH